ncbi:MAG: hypothetical protein AB7K09_17450 [Planctomycetota bacterium]
MSAASEITIPLQESMLREALTQAELLHYVPPVVALSFGVLPLARRKDTLYLACRPDVPPAALPVLRSLVPVPIEGLSFDRDVMIRYLRQLNRNVGGVNLPTFTQADFLTREENLPILSEEKHEAGIDPECSLAASDIMLVEYRYRSWMANLDDPETPMQRYQGDMEVPFRVRDDVSPPRAVVYRADAQKPDAILLTRRQFTFAGTEHGFGIGGQVVTRSELPYVLHPTEIQLRGVHPDSLIFHVYDHDEVVPVGQTAHFDCEYYFLDGGQRQHRKLSVDVLGSWRVARSALQYREHEEFGDALDLERWFD